MLSRQQSQNRSSNFQKQQGMWSGGVGVCFVLLQALKTPLEQGFCTMADPKLASYEFIQRNYNEDSYGCFWPSMGQAQRSGVHRAR